MLWTIMMTFICAADCVVGLNANARVYGTYVSQAECIRYADRMLVQRYSIGVVPGHEPNYQGQFYQCVQVDIPAEPHPQ